MANGDIAPPSEPLTVSGDGCRPSWYRYFVQRKHIEDGVTASAVVTFGDERAIYPNSKQLTVAAGQLTETDNGATLELGLANTAVIPTVYGAADRLVVLSIDQKGRITGAAEIVLNSDNVHEGTTNLFFTQTRARASVSGSAGINYTVGTGDFTLDQSFTRGLLSSGSGINYNSGTGAIATTGFSGGPALYTSLTFLNGICTAAS